jgi:hypothetical protein
MRRGLGLTGIGLQSLVPASGDEALQVVQTAFFILRTRINWYPGAIKERVRQREDEDCKTVHDHEAINDYLCSHSRHPISSFA